MDLEAQIADEYRDVLDLLPDEFLDLSDLARASKRLPAAFAMLAGDAALPATVDLLIHHTTGFDGYQAVLRVFRPESLGDVSPAYLWIHGGGMVLGAADESDLSCAAIAETLNVIVASV